jgi:hypothetical protein
MFSPSKVSVIPPLTILYSLSFLVSSNSQIPAKSSHPHHFLVSCSNDKTTVL